MTQRKLTRILHRYAAISLFLLTIAIACACNNVISQHSASTNLHPSASNCRLIKHAMGETCVPIKPQRIVTISGFAVGSLLSLNVKPVATITDVASIWQDQLKDVENLGTEEQVNLESLLQIKPDLIFASKWTAEAIYDKLTRIAPTVVDDFQRWREWKDVFMLHAEALGMTAQAQQLMEEYRDRVVQLKAHLKQTPPTQVSLVRLYYDGRIILYLKDSFAGAILEEIGISRPPSQNKDDFLKVISKEAIQEADGDIIFVWTFGENTRVAQASQDALRRMKSDPLWLQLNAVKQNRVYEVGNYWNILSSPRQANLIIDDLFKYLIDH
ncbi:iron-siderophore ABC transporter substrate-binding protein [Gloeocapsopsis dulcis]|uniref:Fe/B12 periplasmic-binding domain-containing protein n=1 Tax=Gloeocapsopsis dulcis AAB1 = 1H9 TaxID=1433147 RepID=A0A6N8FRZ6_9CHRO|nr:iron-siderophore ABC transporter substrate-binding protein [Gloeocapsopsis dulcis]MUL35900.1 hypothetical protein [Gloeocapsopsis dulcis AAB1 = 1H9]WNN87632.1 iron-siderophore ABC transporter substrate-binding protein [Gloeocapsopsis dulcis]